MTETASPTFETGQPGAPDAIERLERENAALRREVERLRGGQGRFLAAAAHDLRQPFQAMQLFHHLLLGELTEPKARDLGERLGHAIEAAETLVGTLVELAKLDAGTVAAAPQPVALDDLLATLAEAFAAEAQAYGLRLLVRPCGLWAASDPLLLERLLRPLVANALRFTRSGGVLIGVRPRGECLRIEVWDTGSGVAATDLQAIWEDFRQVGRPLPGRPGGSGLGLPLVRRLAALLGHTLEVKSLPGRGSLFAVRVAPANQPA